MRMATKIEKAQQKYLSLFSKCFQEWNNLNPKILQDGRDCVSFQCHVGGVLFLWPPLRGLQVVGRLIKDFHNDRVGESGNSNSLGRLNKSQRWSSNTYIPTFYLESWTKPSPKCLELRLDFGSLSTWSSWFSMISANQALLPREAPANQVTADMLVATKDLPKALSPTVQPTQQMLGKHDQDSVVAGKKRGKSWCTGCPFIFLVKITSWTFLQKLLCRD